MKWCIALTMIAIISNKIHENGLIQQPNYVDSRAGECIPDTHGYSKATKNHTSFVECVLIHISPIKTGHAFMFCTRIQQDNTVYNMYCIIIYVLYHNICIV